MIWTKENLKKVKDKNVRTRISHELNKKNRLAPVTGDENYWKVILDSEKIDYRKNPELYRIGRGQQGVLTFEPYKSEILPHWRFATEELALVSADTIYQLFKYYLSHKDFVGADMAKKFLHMGFTRARRYANHSAGKKYSERGLNKQRPDALDNEKARSAEIFKMFWDEARTDEVFKRLTENFKSKIQK